MGIHAPIFLVARSPAEPCSTSTIAQALQVSESHLGKVLGTLCKAGLLLSTRGAMGGYQAHQPAGGASVLSVIEVIDGPFTSPKGSMSQPIAVQVGVRWLDCRSRSTHRSSRISAPCSSAR